MLCLSVARGPFRRILRSASTVPPGQGGGPALGREIFSWLEQCCSAGSVFCMFISDDASASRQFDFPVDFPTPEQEGVLQGMRQAPDVPAEDVLLVIASSVPSMSQPHSVASLLPGIDVEEVYLCIVRDFFNTEACELAAAELLGQKEKATAVGTSIDDIGNLKVSSEISMSRRESLRLLEMLENPQRRNERFLRAQASYQRQLAKKQRQR